MPRFTKDPAYVLLIVVLVCCSLARAQVGTSHGFRLKTRSSDPGFEQAVHATLSRTWTEIESCFPALFEKKLGPLSIEIHNDLASIHKVQRAHKLRTLRGVPGVLSKRGRQASVFVRQAGYAPDARWRVGDLSARLLLRNLFKPRKGGQGVSILPAWAEQALALWAEGDCVRGETWHQPAARASGRRYAASFAKALAQGGTLPSLAAIFSEDEALSKAPDESRVLLRVAIHYLMNERRADAQRAFAAAAQQGSRAAFTETFLRVLKERPASPAQAATVPSWDDYVTGLPDKVHVSHYPPHDAHGHLGDATFVPTTPAVHWLTSQVKKSFTFKAQMTLVQGECQGDVVFERTAGKWLRVTFCARQGKNALILSERASHGAPWTVLARGHDLAELRDRRPIPVTIDVKRKRLEVRLAENLVLAGETAGPTLNGRYGVGGSFGNQVSWKGAIAR